MRRWIAIVGVATLTVPGAIARTQFPAGINAFTPLQDVRLGAEAAAAIEHDLAPVGDPDLTGYVERLGNRLARHAAATDLTYQFRLFDADHFAALALPGGQIYVSRGALEETATESELAAILAHMIVHVASRHGTNQLTKQMLISMPFAAVSGEVLAGDESLGEQLRQLGFSIGLDSVILRNSRAAETEADLLGTQLLADAGYDPAGMLRLLERVADRRDRQPERWESFFAGHPEPLDRERRVRSEIALLSAIEQPIVTSTEFEQMKASLGHDSRATAEGTGPTATATADHDPIRAVAEHGQGVRYTSPSDGFSLAIPAGWRVQELADGARLRPDADIPSTASIVVSRYRPPADSDPAPEAALDAQIVTVQEHRPHLVELAAARTATTVKGRAAHRALLTGQPPGAAPIELLTVIVMPFGDRAGSADFLVFHARAGEAEWTPVLEIFRAVLASLRQPLE